jgi:hypothetical protein
MADQRDLLNLPEHYLPFESYPSTQVPLKPPPSNLPARVQLRLLHLQLQQLHQLAQLRERLLERWQPQPPASNPK